MAADSAQACTAASIGPLPSPVQQVRPAVDLDREADALGIAVLEEMMFEVAHGRARSEIGPREQLPDLGGADLAAMRVGVPWTTRGELDLQAARHDDAVFGLQQIGDAALARLAVDADHRVVAAADVGRVDRQVGHVPERIRLLHGKALLDGVLVRAGEGREHEIADVGMARVDRQLAAVLDSAGDGVDVRKVEARVDALRVQLSARVTRSTLPVRSPLPNRQPSTRSAPAIKPSSAAATAVPRSLCGWTLRMTLSRRARWRCIHSIWSA
jgi:hypothetical protein